MLLPGAGAEEEYMSGRGKMLYARGRMSTKTSRGRMPIRAARMHARAGRPELRQGLQLIAGIARVGGLCSGTNNILKTQKHEWQHHV